MWGSSILRDAPIDKMVETRASTTQVPHNGLGRSFQSYGSVSLFDSLCFSAGAGSGEFHIYRNLRRKEQNRMKYIDDEAKKVGLS